ncbi:MAG: hypothetical protein H6594_02530 [Flavobacteriales bacterium]|nr:hypothetical protein [Flavobacteriales bacterium]
MVDKHIQRLREGHRLRRNAINELHFTYKGLQRLLNGMVKRSGDGPLAETLRAQLMQDRSVLHDLSNVAMDHGHPPIPSTCVEADALLAEVYHADRSGAMGQARMDALLQGLKAVRMHLLRTWSGLIDQVPGDVLPRFREAADRLRTMEAQQHRALLDLEARIFQGEAVLDRLSA